jgi:hypothetical protein
MLSVDVLTLEFLLCLDLPGPCRNGCPSFEARFHEVHLFQGTSLSNSLAPTKFDISNGRALFDDHYQNITADFKAHILEQAQCKQRANRC